MIHLLNNLLILVNYFKFDIDKLDEIIEDFKPTIIINCIVNNCFDVYMILKFFLCINKK